jgi:hypothetical protein
MMAADNTALHNIIINHHPPAAIIPSLLFPRFWRGDHFLSIYCIYENTEREKCWKTNIIINIYLL